MFQYAEKMLQDKRIRQRIKNIKNINFKFKNKETSYQEKNNFMEFQIENCLKKFEVHLTQEDVEKQKKLFELKKQILKNELKYYKQKLKKEK